jgi:hypothetical protein
MYITRFKFAVGLFCAVSLFQANSAQGAWGQQSQSAVVVSTESQSKAAQQPPSTDMEQELRKMHEKLDQQSTQIEALEKKVAAEKQNQAPVSSSTSTAGANLVSAKAEKSSAGAKSSSQVGLVRHFGAVTITPYGFLNGESAYRTHATGGELPTSFNALPYEHADSYGLSETYLSGRQSRIGVIVQYKIDSGTLRAVLEGDFLGVGTTSNANQSSSYLYRQRLAFAEFETRSHWAISAGQGWTLATENVAGISNAPTNQASPMTIDPNFSTGFVWNRGGNFRLTKSFTHTAFAVSAENPQILYTASMAGNTPYAVLGSAGANGGLMNASVGSCSPTTVIVNYQNQVISSNAGTSVSAPMPVYKTLNACTNLANVSFNQAPDMLGKVALDRFHGHYEVFGIARFAHQTIYPGETTDSYLYGGLKDIVTGAQVAPTLTAAGSTSNSIVLGGVGASARVQALSHKMTLGLKGLYGAGVGRYGASGLPDVTANSTGAFSPLHNLSVLATAEVKIGQKLTVYSYAGGDGASRADFGSSSTTSLGAPIAMFCANGTSQCSANPSQAELMAGGNWGAHWNAPGKAAVGYGSRLLSNAACEANANPGFNGGSTGFYSGGSCGAQSRALKELTGGYWWDIHKGEKSRLRQGFQYSYADREAWSGASGIGARGLDNMIFTSFRFILP